MKLDELIAEWQQDTIIDETELSRESIKIPRLHGKYLKMFSAERLKLRGMKLKQKQTNKKLIDYYRGDLNTPEDLAAISRDPWAKTVLKQDVQYYVDGDDEMVDLNTRIAYQSELVEVLEEIIKSLNTRGFVIKNSLDFLKFTSGQ